MTRVASCENEQRFREIGANGLGQVNTLSTRECVNNIYLIVVIV